MSRLFILIILSLVAVAATCSPRAAAHALSSTASFSVPAVSNGLEMFTCLAGAADEAA
jgi:hypothetical protein